MKEISRDEMKLIELFENSENLADVVKQLNRVSFRATRKLDVKRFHSVMLFRDVLIWHFEELKNSDKRELSQEGIHLIKVICKYANE